VAKHQNNKKRFTQRRKSLRFNFQELNHYLLDKQTEFIRFVLQKDSDQRSEEDIQMIVKVLNQIKFF